MQSSLYVSLSAQMALQKRMETIASNVANITTAGYRADAVTFQTMISRAAQTPVAFASSGETHISRKPGSVTQTGNPLDVAVVGPGWLAYAGATGQPVYTRDGRMQMSIEGELQTLNGRPVLDAGGVPITVDPNGGPIWIAQDGTVTQDNNQMGTLGIYLIPSDAKLQRVGGSGVVSDRAPEMMTSFVDREGKQALGGVRQGYVENSNVNPVLEMTKLMMASRAFENAAALNDHSEGTLQNAVRTLGEPAKT